jgi:hypothetical protein
MMEYSTRPAIAAAMAVAIPTMSRMYANWDQSEPAHPASYTTSARKAKMKQTIGKPTSMG